MNLFTVAIIALVLGAVFSILVDYLLRPLLPEKPNRRHLAAIVIATIGIGCAFVLFSEGFILAPEPDSELADAVSHLSDQIATLQNAGENPEEVAKLQETISALQNEDSSDDSEELSPETIDNLQQTIDALESQVNSVEVAPSETPTRTPTSSPTPTLTPMPTSLPTVTAIPTVSNDIPAGLALIPAGEFEMGINGAHPNRQPAHIVTLVPQQYDFEG